ncbi:hypothetical protein FACS1894126_2320 [Alphaproteobacteria bacterium]|nr:hypothetical protein FACS1894126_2320 [Alphaproteobacteria bacterium]
MPTKSDLPRNLENLVITMAAMVPNTTDMVADMHAIFRLVTVALSIIGLDINALYHFSEKPDHTVTNLDSLNE